MSKAQRRAELWAACLAAPFDPVPGLILHDWLQGQGDPFGELVAGVQELRRHGKVSPGRDEPYRLVSQVRDRYFPPGDGIRFSPASVGRLWIDSYEIHDMDIEPDQLYTMPLALMAAHIVVRTPAGEQARASAPLVRELLLGAYRFPRLQSIAHMPYAHGTYARSPASYLTRYVWLDRERRSADLNESIRAMHDSMALDELAGPITMPVRRFDIWRDSPAAVIEDATRADSRVVVVHGHPSELGDLVPVRGEKIRRRQG